MVSGGKEVVWKYVPQLQDVVFHILSAIMLWQKSRLFSQLLWFFLAFRIYPLKRLKIVIKIYPNTICNGIMTLCSHLQPQWTWHILLQTMEGRRNLWRHLEASTEAQSVPHISLVCVGNWEQKQRTLHAGLRLPSLPSAVVTYLMEKSDHFFQHTMRPNVPQKPMFRVLIVLRRLDHPNHT